MNTSLSFCCSFFGHRKINISPEIKQNLTQLIEDLIINKHFDRFYFGGLGEFDDLCYQIVSKLKNKYHYIKRVFCLYEPRHQRIEKRPKWLKETDYEEIVYLDLSFDWWYQRIYFRNVEIIDKSDFIIFYVVNTENSGAYKAMRYAEKKKKNYINICTLN